MSAASFLGISAAVMASGYDGLIYSIGFLVGWPVITFLMAERLRNLGKFTFADVAAYRFQQTPIRAFAASGTLVVVAFYLIAQMVGAGQLIKLLFGLDYWLRGGHRRRADDDLRAVRRHDRDHLGADHQGRPAAGRRQLHGLHGAAGTTASRPRRCSPRRWRSRPQAALAAAKTRRRSTIGTEGTVDHGTGLLHQGSDLRDLLRHGADVRHRRPAAHPDALLHRAGCQGSAQVGVLGDHLDRLLLPPDLHHRLRRDRAGAPTRSSRTPRAACSAAATWPRSTSPRRSAATCSSASSRRWRSRPSSRWWPA
jgi:hypothetical protein